MLAVSLGARVAWAGDPRQPDGLPRATVVRAIDGDTVVVLTNGREDVVRLIGVDTPEVHESPRLDREVARSGRDRAAIRRLGKRAAQFTQDRLLGRTVAIERDAELHDRYRRHLAYLWVDDDMLFNAEILRAGYARLMTVPPNVKYASYFRALERAAQAAGRGLWQQGLDDPSP